MALRKLPPPKKKAKPALKVPLKPGPKPYSENPENFLTAIRLKLGLTQLEMAASMGMGLSAYQELEADHLKIRIRHRRMAELAAFLAAAEREDLSLCPEALREPARKIARLMGMRY
jgi:transcriptional regulator with XRE-family HTH domain